MKDGPRHGMITSDTVGFIVHGRITTYDSIEMPRVKVTLYDKNLDKEKELDSSFTDEKGFYQIQFNSSKLNDNRKDKLDLQIKVTNITSDEVLGVSDIHYNADKKEEINLLIFISENKKLRLSEYQILKNDLISQINMSNNDPSLNIDDRIASLKENDQQQEITYLANKTGWDARMIAMLALAHQFTQKFKLKVAPEFFYVLFRAGLSNDEEAIALLTPNIVHNTWEQAIDQQIIPFAFKEKIAESLNNFRIINMEFLLDKERPSSLKKMLDASFDSEPNEEKQKRFVELHQECGLNQEDFWSQIKKEFSEKDFDRLQMDAKLSLVTRNNPSLIRKLHNLENLESSLDLAKDYGLYTSEAWFDLLTDDIDIPEEIPGDSELEKKKNYAQNMANFIRYSHPTAVIAHMAKNNNFKLDKDNSVHEAAINFLYDHAESLALDLHPIQDYIKKENIILAEDPDKSKKILQCLQRAQCIYKLSHTEEIFSQLISDDRISSSYNIVCQGKQEFIDSYKEKLGGENNAQLTYAKAEHVYNTVFNLATSYRLYKNTPQLPALSISKTNAATAKIAEENTSITSYPTLENLFGDLDYCACEHCRSVLSPAAYLVELLQFLGPNTNQTEMKKQPYEELKARRPDIVHLQLTCENTNTLLPYVDLVNEILECHVVNENINEYSRYNVAEDVSSEELLANPKNVNEEAYENLLKTIFPLILPFHKPLEMLRSYFTHFGVPLHFAMEKFYDHSINDVITPPVSAIQNSDLIPDEIDEILERYIRRHEEIPTPSVSIPASQPHPRPIIRPYISHPRIIRGPLSPDPHPPSLFSYVGKLNIHNVLSGVDGIYSKQLILATNAIKINQQPHATRKYSSLDICKENLGFSNQEYELFIDDTISLQLLYGEGSAPSNNDHAAKETKDDDGILEKLSNVKYLSHKLEINYEDLIKIIKTKFINPNGHLISKLEKLHLSLTEIKEFHDKLSKNEMTEEKFNEALPVNLDRSQYGDSIKKWLLGCYPKIKSLILFSNFNLEENTTTFGNVALQYAMPDNLKKPWPETSFFRKLIRFIRLWKKLNMQIEDLDRIITALRTNDPKTSFWVLTPRIFQLKELMKALEIDPQRELLPSLVLWSDIDTYGNDSLYSRLFLNDTIRKIDKNFKEFEADIDGNYLEQREKQPAMSMLASHSVALQAAFNLTNTEIESILQDLERNYGITKRDDIKLTLNNLIYIFRHAYLARKLKISIEELISLKNIFYGTNIFAMPTGKQSNVLDFIKIIKLLKDSNISINQLFYLLKDRNADNEMSPSRDDLLNMCSIIRDELLNINNSQGKFENYDEMTIKDQLLTTYSTNVVNTFFGLLHKTFESKIDCNTIDIETKNEMFQKSDQIDYIDYIDYNNQSPQLIFRGLMTVDKKLALENIESATPNFKEAINALFYKTWEFFAKFSEMKEIYLFVSLYAFEVTHKYNKPPKQEINERLLGEISKITTQLTYDKIEEKLIFHGLMTNNIRESLINIPGTTKEFKETIKKLFTESYNSLNYLKASLSLSHAEMIAQTIIKSNLKEISDSLMELEGSLSLADERKILNLSKDLRNTLELDSSTASVEPKYIDIAKLQENYQEIYSFFNFSEKMLEAHINDGVITFEKMSTSLNALKGTLNPQYENYFNSPLDLKKLISNPEEISPSLEKTVEFLKVVKKIIGMTEEEINRYFESVFKPLQDLENKLNLQATLILQEDISKFCNDIKPLEALSNILILQATSTPQATSNTQQDINNSLDVSKLENLEGILVSTDSDINKISKILNELVSNKIDINNILGNLFTLLKEGLIAQPTLIIQDVNEIFENILISLKSTIISQATSMIGDIKTLFEKISTPLDKLKNSLTASEEQINQEDIQKQLKEIFTHLGSLKSTLDQKISLIIEKEFEHSFQDIYESLERLKKIVDLQAKIINQQAVKSFCSKLSKDLENLKEYLNSHANRTKQFFDQIPAHLKNRHSTYGPSKLLRALIRPRADIRM